MSEKTKKKMTPRQRTAISNPIADPGVVPHLRHHRQNGNVQSYLTFDVSEISSLTGSDELESRSIDGWCGVWHARVSHSPVRNLEAWSPKFIEAGKLALMNMLARVGVELCTEVHNGSDSKSVHVYKWATMEELQIAIDEAGCSLSELQSSQIAEARLRAMAERQEIDARNI